MLRAAAIAFLAPLLLGAAAPYLSPDEVLANSPASDWQPLDPANTLYMDLAKGRVVILLAPSFAPKTVANIRQLVMERYFDDSAIVRTQDNYVVQWSQENKAKKAAQSKLKGYVEFERPLSPSLVRLPDHDTYAPITGFDGDFAVGRDGRSEWLLHCYGMVGAGRDNAPNSGSGVELYSVIGQSPRQLDRNINLVGRVVAGMELLSSLPRGGSAQGAYQGFYRSPSQYTKIKFIRLASELPPGQRLRLAFLKPGSTSFTAYVESLRNRHNAWFVRPAGAIDACNIPLPIRSVP
jgi:peptidylprolyl isomerase